MSSCLGLYIESNVIKYAKVTKERETLKIESFGIKFYEKIGDAITQIVSETLSYDIPLSINMSNETYNYFYMLSSLNRKDLKKAIDTEFESYCYKKKIDKNAYETRFTFSNDIHGKDKVKVIHVSTDKADMTKLLELISDYRVSTITPIGTSIANIVSIKPKENIIIVNIEDKTTITTIINKKVYDVHELKEGSKEILNKIVGKENSFSKAYEICKNSTIYTMEGKDLEDEENEYLKYIMPTLYKIVTKLQDYITNTSIQADKIYITGTMSAVNNIDLYFQEFFKTEKCEVLKPYFVTENIRINIKDYIEVNSAIALALQGLGYGMKSLNFKKASLKDHLPNKSKLDFKSGKKAKKQKINFNLSLSGKLDATEKWLLRGAAGVLMLTLLYSGFSFYLDNRINAKIDEAEDVISYTDEQITLAQDDINLVNQKANRYKEMEDNLKSVNQEMEDTLSLKGSIPNLLMSIMTTIPQEVQITEIENTPDNEGRHIIIKAQSEYYDELGYFKARISEEKILDNVVSTQGEKQDNFVKIVIEGDLP